MPDGTEWEPLALLRDLVALPGPPGQEEAVRRHVSDRAAALGLPHAADARGNLLVGFGDTVPEAPRVVVTAHLDEIALQVTGVDPDGCLAVAPLGGAHPWKWGEGPVEVMARGGRFLPGVLSFGSIHTTSPLAYAQQAREGRALTWDAALVLTGLSRAALVAAGVRAGTRVVLARQRRVPWEIGGGLIASYFLDDRADLVAWLLALEALRRDAPELAGQVLFAATAAEEVGGHGALWLLGRTRPEVCIALEIGPRTPDAPFPLDADPTVWVSDGFAPSLPADLDLVDEAAAEVGLSPHFHVVTRGGSDASCAAAQGLCARPITLAFPAENSHGFEVMHRDAPAALAKLTAAVVRRVLAGRA